MTMKSAAERALSQALGSGGDFAELYMEDARSSGMSLIDGKVDTSTTGRSHGAGMRVYKGLSSVYVHANDTSPESLLRHRAAGGRGGRRAGRICATCA